MNINSSNYYSTSASSNSGISGMISGWDTDTMVKQMLSGTQSKLDKLNQTKTQTEWKQESYRSIISSINAFRNTYFDTSYDSALATNFANAKFFNTMKSVVQSGSAVSVVGSSSSAVTGSMEVVVNALATNAKLTTAAGTSVSSGVIVGSEISQEHLNALAAEGAESRFTVTLDGVDKTITLSADDFTPDEHGDVSLDDLQSVLQDKLNDAFGDYVKVETNAAGGLNFSYNTSVGNPDTGHQITLTGIDTGADLVNLGIEPGASTRLTGMNTLGWLMGSDTDSYEFTLNGETFTFDADETISGVLNAINKSSAGVTLSYSAFSDSFTMVQNSTGVGNQIELSTEADEAGINGNALLEKLFGAGYAGNIERGADASVTVNGVTTTRSSNTFTLDGVTMKLKSVSPAGEATVIGTERDADTIVDAFKGFVDDYNKLIKELNDLISEDPTYKDYPPLTDEQKKEMSDKEIEEWNAKTKIGLLRADSDISTFLQQMRSTLYTKPEGCAYSLYDIGIETGTYKEKGQLHLDETALRAALSNDPDSVAQLFTDSTSGLSKQLTAVIDATAKSGTGVLDVKAGTKGTSTENNNEMYRTLKTLSSRIDDMKDKYQKEKEKYWNMFTQMETTLSNYSTQLSYLTSSFSS